MGLTTQTFDILTRIAIGNGSLVYKGVDKESLRKVALKLLTRDEELDHGYDVDALFAAVPQLRLITGSHVCQLLDAINDDDGPVLVYEFAGGISGAEFPHRRKLDAQQAIDVAAQLMSAIRSGERQRTPHGDLKPSNMIFVDTPEGRPFTFVLDWGLASFRPELTKDSRPYLAPERLAGGPVSHQADLFAAGAVLFYLLTCKVLAIGDSDEELRASWARARPEILADLRPDLPPKFVQWVSWLLSLDPQKRPGSAVDAATALAMLNPPAPMAPPEEIRPRPLSASQRAQAAGLVSGVNAPSQVTTLPASSVSRPPGSGVRAAPAKSPPSTSAQGPARSASPGAILNSPGELPLRRSRKITAIAALSVALVGTLAATGVWWMRRETPSPIPAVAEAASPKREERMAANATATGKPSGELFAAVAAPAEAPKAGPAAKRAALAPSKAANEKPVATKPSPPKPPAPATPAMVATAKPMAPPSVLPAALGSKPIAPGATRAAVSSPVVAESFAYANGAAIDAQKSGRGWQGGWEANGAQVRAGSLPYPGMLPSGGALEFPGGEEKRSARRVMGLVAPLIENPKKAGHWYFATLIRVSDQSPGAGGEVRIYPLDPDNSGRGPYISVADMGQAARVSLSGSQLPLLLPDANRPILLVCRMEVQNPKDNKWDLTMSLLVNPPVDRAGFKEAGTPIKAVFKGTALPAQTGVLILKSGGSAAAIVDELRFSEHWDDLQLGGPKAAAPRRAPGGPTPGA